MRKCAFVCVSMYADAHKRSKNSSDFEFVARWPRTRVRGWKWLPLCVVFLVLVCEIYICYVA